VSAAQNASTGALTIAATSRDRCRPLTMFPTRSTGRTARSTTEVRWDQAALRRQALTEEQALLILGTANIKKLFEENAQ
jgi:hypothetical protein